MLKKIAEKSEKGFFERAARGLGKWAATNKSRLANWFEKRSGRSDLDAYNSLPEVAKPERNRKKLRRP